MVTGFAESCSFRARLGSHLEQHAALVHPQPLPPTGLQQLRVPGAGLDEHVPERRAAGARARVDGADELLAELRVDAEVDRLKRRPNLCGGNASVSVAVIFERWRSTHLSRKVRQ